VRTESRFLIGAGAFGAFVGIVYWFLSYEQAGFVMLLFMGLASSFIGGYLLWKMHSVSRAEDDPDADHAASAGVVAGRFSAGSIWPLVMALGLVSATVGLMLESRD
jgi:hypothetical protein